MHMLSKTAWHLSQHDVQCMHVHTTPPSGGAYPIWLSYLPIRAYLSSDPSLQVAPEEGPLFAHALAHNPDVVRDAVSLPP